jgi:hypothetical protein
MPQVDGSGTADTSDTPSSSMKGGAPVRLPLAMKDSNSLLFVAVKVMLAWCQPVKPWLTLARDAVCCLLLPSETSQ